MKYPAENPPVNAPCNRRRPFSSRTCALKISPQNYKDIKLAYLVSREAQIPRCPWTSQAVVMEFRSEESHQTSDSCQGKPVGRTRQNDSFALALAVSTPSSPSLRFNRELIAHDHALCFSLGTLCVNHVAPSHVALDDQRLWLQTNTPPCS